MRLDSRNQQIKSDFFFSIFFYLIHITTATIRDCFELIFFLSIFIVLVPVFFLFLSISPPVFR
ncbi:hypothetical protein J3R30DRAFT_2950875 [Lentinula aciculospora]|uniref:Uncharacterized protein n=1 Tax=Lentinula aciculospora TaxID=153920 RepID=A0A9W9DDN8_9AGAR|nr:hypothetical protein J3R30DRAFT_2950875 [Lentinula aciculospora]